MSDLLLIRHAQAIHNKQGRLDGWGATPLTPKGQRQARAIAGRLGSWSPPVTHLYTSPLRRARQTAAHIAGELQLDPVVCDDLREIDFGQLHGMTLNEFRQTCPELFARWSDRSDLAFQYPDGEQRLAFFQRAGRAIEEIIARHPADWVAVVAHGGTLRAALAHLLRDTMKDWWAYDLHNASLTHVRAERGKNSLVALNDCLHLDEGAAQ